MKKYILIQNDGEIESNSFELIGASTKRDDSSKIGFFGSGLKYSIAYMMRNNIGFKIYSGEQELVFTTIPENLRDQIFERICINGKPTSYTITMGVTWTEDWFVLREIYCNALDESSCQMVRETENVNAVAGKTRIYIEATNSLKSIIENWDAYFSTDRTPILIGDNIYTSYLGKCSKQSVSVYLKTDGVIFRKGIRVDHLSKSIYDYGFDDVSINEDRTAKSSGAMDYVFSNMLGSFASENYVVSVLRTGSYEKPCSEYKAMSSTKPDSFSNEWVDFSKKYFLVLLEKSGKYTNEIAASKKEIFYIPQYFAKELKNREPDVIILGMGKSIGDTGIIDVETTAKMDYLLKSVLGSLNDMSYNVPYEIQVVQFDDDHVLGMANIEDKKIYLSDTVFDMGRREIAMTIIEETEHIISKCQDETRAFQTHIFSSWLKTMENSNGIFL
jgi:hypothetical protein